MRILCSLLVLALMMPAHAQEVAKEPKLEDVATMDAIVAAVYQVISGAAGEKRDWDRMRSLFHPQAKMMVAVARPTGETVLRTLTVEDYIKTSGPVLEERGFFEREISRKVESFGSIAHIFSTYEARQQKDDEKPFMRGINSIQLLNDGKRWWVLSIYWQAEDAKNPLPAKYLPDGKQRLLHR